jgi:uncharacterized membrane protein
MLYQGPLPALFHGVIEYAAAVLLIAAPFLFGFEDEEFATAAAIVLGLGILALTATSDLPTGLVRSVPASLHATADVVLAIVLVAAPFVLGFRDVGQATALFITLGVVHLLVTIATRFPERRSARTGSTGETVR